MTLDMKCKKLYARVIKKRARKFASAFLGEKGKFAFEITAEGRRSEIESYAASCELIKSVSMDYHHFIFRSM